MCRHMPRHTWAHGHTRTDTHMHTGTRGHTQEHIPSLYSETSLLCLAWKLSPWDVQPVAGRNALAGSCFVLKEVILFLGFVWINWELGFFHSLSCQPSETLGSRCPWSICARQQGSLAPSSLRRAISCSWGWWLGRWGEAWGCPWERTPLLGFRVEDTAPCPWGLHPHLWGLLWASPPRKPSGTEGQLVNGALEHGVHHSLVPTGLAGPALEDAAGLLRLQGAAPVWGHGRPRGSCWEPSGDGQVRALSGLQGGAERGRDRAWARAQEGRVQPSPSWPGAGLQGSEP